MARILAIANQKGGVGKTTTAINLSASLAAAKRSILLVDLDPQGNATMGSGINKHDLQRSTYDVLVEGAAVESVCIFSPDGGYDVLPANQDLTAAEVQLLQMDQRESRLKNALLFASQQYDYIILDCPPSLNMLTINGLSAADGVIIPMQCEYYALEGLTDLLTTIESIRTVVNAQLQVEGILRTMYDPRSSLTRDVSAQLTQHFADKVYRTCIPRNIRLAEAPSFGLPALAYDRSSRGALAYFALAGEILRKDEQQTTAAPEAAAEV